MTEAEWQECRDPQVVLAWLGGRHVKAPYRWLSRKLQLFNVACCRRMWHLITDERSRKAVEFMEQAADTDLIRATYHQGWAAVSRAAFKVVTHLEGPALSAARAAAHCMHSSHSYVAACATVVVPVEQRAAERVALCDLLRDLFGPLLFRPAPVLDSAWLMWDGGIVARLAEAIYTERAFDRLGILADALQEAGCSEPGLLAHLRGPGPHARGCWALDWIRGRPSV
jgi:hypothetical protein